MLTEVQKRFVELEKKKAEYRKFIEEFKEATEDVVDEIGIGGMFQDEDGTVYQMVIPNGKFVYFDHVGYVRTRRGDEKRGDLSLKKAIENGYEVK